MKNLELNNVNFSNSEIINSDLKGVDFSSCNIEFVKFDLKSVYGIIIDRFQSVELVNLLGVIVK